MEDLENKSVLELTMMLNEIHYKIRDLETDYNVISFELQNRVPSLKGDEDLKMRGERYEHQSDNNKF